MNTETRKGYLWAELDITDPEGFEREYSVHVRPMLERHGGRFLILDDRPRVVEGGRHVRRVLLVEFDSVASASAFYDSPEYQALIGARLKNAHAHLYLVEGTPCRP